MTSSFLLVSLLLLPAASGVSVSDFTSKSSACASDYSCEASSRTSGSSGPMCRCDKECIIYGDCCYDAPTYDRAKQIQNLGKRQCIGGSYMFNTCPEEWQDTDVESLCRNHSPLDIADSRDPVLHLPVTSKITNFTYSNYYCALCHSDAVNIEVWNSKMQCFFTSNNKTSDGNTNNTNMLQDLLNLRKDRITLREGTDDEKSLKLIKPSLKFNKERKKWLITNSNNSDIIMECSFNLDLNKVRPSNKCSSSISSCAANWTNKEVENLCLSLSAPVDYYSDCKIVNNSGIVYAKTNVTPISYRNMFCAECNYNPIESPCLVFVQQDTRDKSFPIPPLTVLLHVPEHIHRINLQANANCKDNETFIHLYNTKDICILCQTVREQNTEGKCIAKNYDYELQGGPVTRENNEKNVFDQNTTLLYEDETNISCDEFFIWNNSFLPSTRNLTTEGTSEGLHKKYNKSKETMRLRRESDED
ncbi:uncharacterized protein LOC135200072 [Macrobrachium nipponense]|uniref:uncharacterized protein LOC135200072 n=1 Tax=Macrobrachium nipponense TaxID=159736 RepID=UPI0030C8B685